MAVSTANFSTLLGDYTEASFDSLGDACQQLHALESTVRSGQLGLIAEMLLRDDPWRCDARDLAGWLELRLGVSRYEAKEMVRIAEALRSLPLLSAAFADGLMSWNRLSILCSFVTPEDEELYVRQAPEMSISQLHMIRRAKDEVAAEETTDAFARRRLSFQARREMMTVRGQFPLELGREIELCLSRIAAANTAKPLNDVWPEYELTLADALAELASCTLGDDADPDRATVVVEVTASDLLSGGPGNFDNLATMANETVRRLACDARLQFITFNNGQAVGVGRATRLVPAWLRRQLKERDGGCRFPGCSRRSWLDAHHIEFWGEGGPTDLVNLISLCKLHHHLLHEAGWVITGDPGGEVVFTDPFGRAYRVGCPGLRPRTWERFVAFATDTNFDEPTAC